MSLINFLLLRQDMDFVEWLIDLGLGLGEAAHVIVDMESGNSLGISLLKAFKNRQILIEENSPIKNTEYHNWRILRSKSGKTCDGFPASEILCRSPDEIPQAIIDHKIADPVITNYVDELKKEEK